MSNPNSLMEALRVLPRIWSPFECLESLKIRNTLTNRITLRMASDMAEMQKNSYVVVHFIIIILSQCPILRMINFSPKLCTTTIYLIINAHSFMDQL